MAMDEWREDTGSFTVLRASSRSRYLASNAFAPFPRL
jgi:hypothetical protein